MNLRDAKEQINQWGMTLTKRDGEFRIAPKFGTAKTKEDKAYYTNNLSDAVNTARLIYLADGGLV